MRALANIELIAPPGQRYEYSNANYVTLGMIIQAVSGQSYETYITEHIFQPLDMQNSFASKTEAEQDGLAVGYQKWFGIPVASPNLPFSRGSLPAGYLTMSAEDFGHYLIAQLNDGNYQGVSVLSPAGIAELHHPDVQMPGSTDFYAMGWEVQQYQNVQVIGHNGAVPGYTTGMFLVPEKDLAVALVMNTYSPMLGIRVSRVPSSVLRMLLGQEIIPGYEFPYMQIVLRSRDVDSFIAYHRHLHYVPSHPFLAEEYADSNADASCTLYRIAVDLERRHRLYTACDFAKCIRGEDVGHSSFPA